MKIGFVLNSIGNNQIAYDLISSLNDVLKDKKQTNTYILFTENIEHPIKTPPCPVMHASELWSFDGVAIATSMSTGMKLIKAIGPKEKFLYLYSPEWFGYGHIKQYEFTHATYMNPEVNIITRNEDYNKLFMSCFNREPDFIWKELDVKDLLEKLNARIK